MTYDRVIGNGPNIPWNIPEELKFFKETTLNSTLVMGSTTIKSIGRLLPKRNHVILSRKPKSELNISGKFEVCDCFSEAIETARNLEKDIFICGGREIYKQALEYDVPHELIISYIKEKYVGDVYFPDFLKYGWQAISIIHETDSFITIRFKK